MQAGLSSFRSASAIVCGTEQIHPSSKPDANDTAVPASFIFRAVNREMQPPILLWGTVWRLSKFTAQVFGNPSSFVGARVQYGDSGIAREDQYRPLLVRCLGCVPADITSIHDAPQSCSLCRTSNSPGTTGLRE
jgi:hypothetical protein